MYKKLTLIVIFTIFIAFFYISDLAYLLSFATIKARLGDFDLYYQQNPFLTIALFMVVYIMVTALSIPGAALLTLLAGALFGVLVGTVMVSFASTIGATIAFLLARFLIGNYVQKRYAEKLSVMNAGIEKEGWLYLLTLRMIPVFPFFVINLMMGLTKIKIMTFFITSQIGMLAGTIVYVFAGQELVQIESLENIISVDLVFAFTLLGLLPIMMKWLVSLVKAKRGE